MPYLMSFALEHEIVTFARIGNSSAQFPLNIYATIGSTNTVIGNGVSRVHIPGGQSIQASILQHQARIPETCSRVGVCSTATGFAEERSMAEIKNLVRFRSLSAISY